MCLSSPSPSSQHLSSGNENGDGTIPLLCHKKHLLDGGEEASNIEESSEGHLALFREITKEMKTLSRIVAPATVTGLLIYVRSLVSMLFLGHLGQLELAAGSLSIGFANITGYSVIFGLAMGMEPICGQAYGAQKLTLLSLALHRTVVILLFCSFPISLLWLNIDRILLYLHQDGAITKMAKTYLLYLLPDLITQSLLHPIRIYLRSQNINQPVMICSAAASLAHIPLNYLLVVILKKGIKGVAMALVLTNFNLLLVIICYIYISGVYRRTWTKISIECLREWRPYLSLAIPSCLSICMEWWWYEVMILLCGLLDNPKETVSAIGILIQTTSLVYIFPSSLSVGVSTRVAHHLGAGWTRGARWAAAVGTTCGALMGVVAMGFTLWARRWWGHIFTSGAGVLTLASVALPIVRMCELGNCPQTVMCGVLRGSARADIGARVNLAAFYGVGFPMALFLRFWVGLGFVGLWLGLLSAQLTCAMVLGVVSVRTDWRVQVKRAEEITRVGSGVDVDSSNQV